MEHVAQTATATRTKVAAIASAVLGMSLALTACSGATGEASGHDGEYLRAEDDTLMSLVIDGNKVTQRVLDCDDKADKEKTSVGELNDDATSINWTTSAGEFDADDGTFDSQSDVTITDTALVIPYTYSNTAYGVSEDRQLAYAREDSDQGKAARAEYQKACAAEVKQHDAASAAASIPIQDGTYYGYDQFGGVGLTVDGPDVTFYQVSCGPGMKVAKDAATLSDRQLTWADKPDAYPGQLVPIGDRLRLSVGGTGSDRYDFDPEGTAGADEALTYFKSACGDVPFPIG